LFYDSKAGLARMTLTVKLIGALKPAAGSDTITVNYRKGLSIKGLLKEVTTLAPELKRSLVDPQLEDQGLNALILLNSKEISALNGLDTKLKDKDEIVFVPVVHGG